MPMGTNLNLDMRNIRLPELPGVGVQPGGVGVQPSFRQSSVGVQLPPLQTKALPDTSQSMMPFFPQEQAEPKRLDLKTGEDGKVDWLATLISAGALAAGALTGNTRLAAAGSGFLQGQQQGREQRALAQERQLVRDEAKAERDFSRQEKADTLLRNAEQNIYDRISRGEHDLAYQELNNVDAATRARLKPVIDESKKKYDAEKLTKEEKEEKEREERLFANGFTSPEAAIAVSKIIKDPEKIKTLTDFANKEYAEKGSTEKNHLLSGYLGDINGAKTSGALQATKSLIANNTRLTSEEKTFLLDAAETALKDAIYDETRYKADSLAKAGDFKGAASAYKELGVNVTTEDLVLSQLEGGAARLVAKYFEEEKQEMLLKKDSKQQYLTPQEEAIALQNAQRKAKLIAQGLGGPLENQPVGIGIGFQRYVQDKAKEISTGAISAEDVIKDINNSKSVPSDSVATVIKKQIFDNASQNFLNTLGN